MIKLETDYPVAYESLDHLHPFGTVRDNNSNTRFIYKLKNTTAQSVMDIGCAGGLFVKELNDSGFLAIGVEGSDINQKTKRAEWATIPDKLFTADATKPFVVSSVAEDTSIDYQYFDLVTAWEFFEHIEESDLDGVMSNIFNHTKSDSYLICSIANFPSPHDGVELHRIQKDLTFWLPFFEDYGFFRDREMEIYFTPDWVRHGTYNLALKRK